MEQKKIIPTRKIQSYDDRKRVLVVDDNPILLRTAKEMLDEQYQVSIAVSAEQAFKSIARNMPDIILLDYEMPFVNGVEVLNQLRANSNTKDIPIIFFTGSSDREVVEKLVGLKPDGYLLKPPNKKRMLSIIERTLYPELYEIGEDETPEE
ncbi:MAG: response regulator [Ruminiclostridium sp.]|nr:response regulator [Ruminiclostridium sp.]